MEHNRTAVGRIESVAAVSGLAYHFCLFVNYIIASNHPGAGRQVGDDVFVRFVRAKHVLAAGPGKPAKVGMKVREDTTVGSHFPKCDMVIDYITQVL